MIKYSQYFKILVAVLAFLGLLLNTLQSSNIIESFSYFTLQSNLFVFVLYTVLVIKGSKLLNNQTFFNLYHIATISITITMLVYHLALRPILTEMNASDFVVNDFRDLLLHTFVPLTVLLDYLFFNQAKTTLTTHFLALIPPIFYVFYTIIYTSLGGRYHLNNEVYQAPYFFLDVGTHGFFFVFLWSLFILFLFFWLSYVVSYLSHKIKAFVYE